MAMTKSPIDIARETGMSLSQVLKQIGSNSGWGDQYLDTGPIVAGDGNTWLGNGDGTYNVYANDPSANNSPAAYNGRAFDKYRGSGEKIGGGTLSGYQNGSFMSDYGPFLMAAAGMAPALMGAGAAGAGGAAGASGAGAPASFGVVDGSIGAGAGAGGAGSTFGVVDGTIGTGTAGVGAGGYGAGANYALTGAGAAGAGGAGLTGAGAAGAGLLGTGLTAADALKYGLPIAGALAGSQGVKTSQDSTRKTDPRVDPFLFGGQGTPGLLGYAQQQLGRDMSPASIANLEAMRAKGMGLLNQPVAQNGFDRFTKGRY